MNGTPPDIVEREFPYEPRSLMTSFGRMAYVETGRGAPVLFVHGNPTWGFLWRKVMRALAPDGMRLFAPDLIGFGRSDKPRSVAAHTLARHGDALRELMTQLDLNDVTLVVQDWGGPIGTWAAARSDLRIRALVILNTSILLPRRFLTSTFHRLARLPIVSDVAFRGLNFPIPALARVQGDRGSMPAEVQRAYAWPLRRMRDRAGPLALARMVPSFPGHPSVAELQVIAEYATRFRGKVELVWGVRDPILGRALPRHREALPHAQVTETQAGHFLQEEVPEQIAQAVRRVASA